MVGESNQNVFLIQIDASKKAEFEMSEFEISRFDCTCNTDIYQSIWSSDLSYQGHTRIGELLHRISINLLESFEMA